MYGVKYDIEARGTKPFPATKKEAERTIEKVANATNEFRKLLLKCKMSVLMLYLPVYICASLLMYQICNVLLVVLLIV